ncbi:extracellular solute-binding protein [Pseudomonas aeruginosa]|uniref:extracellular solute-binding protein n=1 Tax=Pseudomonas aeruginosa TaxID=287 RepID=UPI0038578699
MLAASGADRYVTPYMWGVVGLMVNQPLAEKEYGAPLPNSWSLIFDPEATERLVKCGVSMLNAEQEAVSLKMTYKGLRLGGSGARRIHKEVAGLLNPGVRLSPADYNLFHEQMASGEVCVAMTWDLLVPRDEKKSGLRFSVPEEGGLIFIDSMAVPKNAINPKLAYAFMNFLLEPSAMARNSRLSHAVPAIRASLLPDGDARLRRGFSREERKRLYLLDSLSEKQRKLLGDAWQALSLEKTPQ